MSETEARAKNLALVPVWWPILTAFLAAVFSAGATYTTIGYRITNVENDVAAIKQDRKDTLKDYTIWRSATDVRLSTVEIGYRDMSKTIDRIADKLGVVH